MVTVVDDISHITLLCVYVFTIETTYSPVLRKAFADAGNEELSTMVEKLIEEGVSSSTCHTCAFALILIPEKCILLRKAGGEYIFREGDEALAVYILLSGTVRTLSVDGRIESLR